MLAGMEGLRRRPRAWPSRAPSVPGSPAASPVPPLPDNPKPTTRPRPRAPTAGRGEGRAPTAPPAPCAPALPRRGRGGRLRRSPSESRLRVPPALGEAPRPPGAAAASVWPLWPPPRAPSLAAGPLPLPSRGRPAASPLAGQRRSRPLARRRWACLPACPSVCPPLGVSRAASGCPVFPWARRASRLWLASNPCL